MRVLFCYTAGCKTDSKWLQGLKLILSFFYMVLKKKQAYWCEHPAIKKCAEMFMSYGIGTRNEKHIVAETKTVGM